MVGWFPASYVKVSGDSKAEEGPKMVKALFQYAAQRDDELSMEQDDLIKLISKEDDVWWKGELNGKEGVFPSNYVEMVD